MKNTVRFIAGAALWIFCSLTSQAQTWTAVGSTGAIDPVSFPHVSLAGPALTFTSSSSATTLIVRYNVTNTFDNNVSPNKPGWTRMEIGYFDPGTTGSISGRLFEVDPCTGDERTVCAITSINNTTCASCVIDPTRIDFSTHLYYIQVTVDRTTTTVFPSIKTVRTF